MAGAAGLVMHPVMQPVWEGCAALSAPSFPLRLFGKFAFDFHLASPWPVHPIRRALAFGEASHETPQERWSVYAATTAQVDIAPLLTGFSRDRHGRLAWPDSGKVAFYDALHGLFRCYDFAHQRAVILCPPDYDFPEWELHSPFREFWHLWALSHRGMLIHSGMVCDGDKAVLLPGAGGSGKSTTVLSCLEHGLTTTGDDYNLILCTPQEIIAAPLYANLKIKTPPLADFSLLREWPGEKLPYAAKSIYYPPADAAMWNRCHPRVTGILCPALGATQAAISPIRPVELLNRLAVSSVMQSPFMAQEYLACAGALAKRVKSAKLHLSPEPAANAQAVRAWL